MRQRPPAALTVSAQLACKLELLWAMRAALGQPQAASGWSEPGASLAGVDLTTDNRRLSKFELSQCSSIVCCQQPSTAVRSQHDIAKLHRRVYYSDR